MIILAILFLGIVYLTLGAFKESSSVKYKRKKAFEYFNNASQFEDELLVNIPDEYKEYVDIFEFNKYMYDNESTEI